MYEVSKDIPPPPKGAGRASGRPSKYPFASMEIGDSFLVPYPRAAKDEAAAVELRRKTKNTITNAAHQYKIRSGNRSQDYTTHASEEGVRVWRIA